MRLIIRRFIEAWKADYSFKTFSSSAMSAIIGITFTIYNGFLGIYYHSVWNGSICVYYCALAMFRMLIIHFQRLEKSRTDDDDKRKMSIHFWTHFIFFFLNITLIAPIAYMVKGERRYTFGLIPAISMAAYTTYRIVMAVMNARKSYRHQNSFLRELRMLNIVDTAVAVLTLQNTMIMTVEGNISGSMFVLSAISSAVIWFFIVVVSIVSFQNGRGFRD